MDINKEREAFEIEFSKIKSDISFWVNTWDEDMQGYNHPVMCWIWHIWQAAKSQAVPEKDAVINKLSDQLYAQEMKTSAARVLCETACELLDDYAHQDAMVILNDLKQAMKEPAND